jgi:hypothetical protein
MNFKVRMISLLLGSVLILTACGAPPVVVPTEAAVAVVGTAVVGTAVATTAIDSETELPSLPAPTAEMASGERPLLPRFSGDTAANIVADAASPFSATTFNLNADLPDQPASAPAFRAQSPAPDLAHAQRLAGQFGFDGPLYTQQFPAGVAQDVGYYAFAGSRSLNVNEFNAMYTDSSVNPDYNTLPDPAQSEASAEAFLQERGLLTFPYEMQPGWSGEVAVVRLIDGRPANQPEISVGVTNAGQVAYVSYQALATSEQLGDYPLQPAAQVWQQLTTDLTGGLARGEIFLTVAQPTAVSSPPVATPTSFQYWPRIRQSAPEAHLYAWPAVYIPVEGDGPPRVQVLNYELQADPDTLQAIAGQVGQNVHVWGALDVAANTLAVAGWEALPGLEPIMKNGVLQQAGDQMQLVEAQTGATFILPDAPPDLTPEGEVNVIAWGVRDAGLPFPVLDWEGIDKQVGETAVLDPALTSSLYPTLAESYDQITIDQVALAYVYSPIYDATAGALPPIRPDVLWHPAWLFGGTANNGDRLLFYIPAVDPAYVQP